MFPIKPLPNTLKYFKFLNALKVLCKETDKADQQTYSYWNEIQYISIIWEWIKPRKQWKPNEEIGVKKTETRQYIRINSSVGNRFYMWTFHFSHKTHDKNPVRKLSGKIQ